jgi:hypothetical protein
MTTTTATSQHSLSFTPNAPLLFTPSLFKELSATQVSHLLNITTTTTLTCNPNLLPATTTPVEPMSNPFTDTSNLPTQPLPIHPDKSSGGGSSADDGAYYTSSSCGGGGSNNSQNRRRRHKSIAVSPSQQQQSQQSIINSNIRQQRFAGGGFMKSPEPNSLPQPQKVFSSNNLVSSSNNAGPSTANKSSFGSSNSNSNSSNMLTWGTDAELKMIMNNTNNNTNHNNKNNSNDRIINGNNSNIKNPVDDVLCQNMTYDLQKLLKISSPTH